MPAEIFRFEDLELDRTAFELRRAGRMVPLERIPLELLCLLVERRGQLVTRREILERIWGKDVFVDADNAINTAVRKIRLALKDSPEHPRFLHTIPAKGYRFDANLAEPHAATPIRDSFPPPAAAIAPAKQPRPWALWVGLAAVAFFAVLALWPFLPRRARPSSGRVMLVVVPFVNMNDDPHQNYFADGMTEEMITQLGSLDPAHLGVIARTSAMKYKDAHKDAAQISQELGVQYLLEGSVRRDGSHVRVTAQLIRSGDQTHLWADSFDRDLTDILKLQSDVARAIAGKIQLTLSQQTENRLAAASAVKPEALEAYLQGLQAWNLRTKDGIQRAITDFERAVTVDPDYALAYSGLARAYMLAPVFGADSSADSGPRARDAATRALAIDDSVSEAHTVLGFVKAHFDFDWPGAEREFLRGIALNPSDANSHFFYSNSYLSPRGRHEEAISELQKAVDLDPFSLPIQSFMGRTYLWARRYKEAEAQFQKVKQLNPNFVINRERLARLYAFIGKYQEAIDEETAARILAGQSPKATVSDGDELRHAYATAGAQGYWLNVLELSRSKEDPPEGYSSPFGTAIVLAELGQREKAIDSLEKAYAEHNMALTEINIEPAFDPLKSSPRFSDLLHRVHLLP